MTPKEKDKIIEHCRICKRVISCMRGHKKYHKYMLCTNCYNSFRKCNLDWFCEKLEKALQSQKAKETEFIRLLKEFIKDKRDKKHKSNFIAIEDVEREINKLAKEKSIGKQKQ